MDIAIFQSLLKSIDFQINNLKTEFKTISYLDIHDRWIFLTLFIVRIKRKKKKKSHRYNYWFIPVQLKDRPN